MEPSRPAPGEPGTLPLRARPAYTGALWTAVAGAVLFLRFPDWFVRPRIWAEDGPVFFLQARVDGASAILTPYAAYLHLVPRLIAALGSLLDPSWIPALYAYASFALTLWVVARVFSPRLDLPGKPLLALAIVAVPHTGEVFLCPTNVQWILALALALLALMRDPATRAQQASDLATVAGAGLTGPFCIFVLPLFAMRAFVRRSRPSWVLFAAVALASLVQGWMLTTLGLDSYPNRPHGPFDPLNLAAVLSARIALALLGGQDWSYLWGRGAVIGAGVLLLCAIAALAWVGRAYRRERLVLLLLMGLVVLSGAMKTRADLWYWNDLVSGDRYFYIPKVLALWIAIVAFPRGSRPARWGAGAAAAAGLWIASSLPYPDGLNFSARHVERPYFEWESYCMRLRQGRDVDIRISPGWTFSVPQE
jgi:hypothetical protein